MVDFRFHVETSSVCSQVSIVCRWDCIVQVNSIRCKAHIVYIKGGKMAGLRDPSIRNWAEIANHKKDTRGQKI